MTTIRDETILLMLTTTRLRRNELFNLTSEDMDFDRRMISPTKDSRTKRTYLTFYNEEAENYLEKYLNKGD